MQNTQQPFAVVAGLDHINGIQTVRILARHRVPVIGVAKDPEHYCSKTRLCERILFTDTGSEELIDSLVKAGPNLGPKAVLYPCTDAIVSIISKHRERLEPWYHIILPPHDTVAMLMDKTQFYAFAEQNGFPVSHTLFIHNRGEAEKVAGEFTFPCIVKPPFNSIPAWDQNSKLKAYLFDTPEEFLGSYDLLSSWSPTLIVQEWIVGPVRNLFSCNCYFNKNGEPVATFIARKLRQWPPETGDSCLGEECRNDDVLNETIRLFKSVNYRGLGYVELKQDSRTGKHYIVEPNIGRPTGRSAIAEAGGVEIIYSMYCDAVGLPLPLNREQKYGNTKWIYFGRDFQSALHYYRKGKLTLGEWIRSLRGIKMDAIFAWNDPAPFFYDLFRAIKVFTSSEERKKRSFN
jgi:predicted ATP-grasp superfamily ATP-dependent carboligase